MQQFPIFACKSHFLMRLGQLARHLETTTTEIVDFLQKKGVDKNDHPNVKLSEQDEEDVIAHFRPDLIQVQKETTESETELTAEESTKPNPISPPEEVIDEVAPGSNTKEADINIEESTSTSGSVMDKQVISITAAELNAEDEEGPVVANFDVIKAPKVELPGLKVVGKIELPEPTPKKEEENEEPEEVIEATDATKETKVIRHHRKNSKKRLTDGDREARRLKNKREREKRIARQEARKKQQEEKRLKQLKEAHYKEKISKPVTAVTKPKKKKNNKSTETKDNRPKPKTLLGKFWRWLNT